MKKKTTLSLLVVLVLICSALILTGCPPQEEEEDPQPEEQPQEQVETVTYDPIDYSEGFEFPGDWGEVPVSEMTVFYPGQSSWQYLVSEEHPGAGAMEGGASCSSCHQGQEERLGESLVNHDALEDDPIEGKEPHKELLAQAAYDDENFYLKLQWESERPGISHQLWRYNGEDWERDGGPRPDVDSDGNIPSYEDRVTMLFTDQDIPAYDGADIGWNEAGCFITCHDSMRAMPEAPSREEVVAHPYLGEEGLNRSDIRKYLLATRTDYEGEGAGWDNVKPESEIEAMYQEGMFLDLWQFRGNRSAPIQYASDDYVLEYRFGDDGEGPFTSQNEIEWMYDPDQTDGLNAIPEDRFEEMLEMVPLKPDENGIPFDEDTEFQEGDLLPYRLLRDPSGSAADVRAYSTWENGIWTVVFVRSLDTGNPDDKALVEGEIYTVGFGLFDDHVSNRRHHVSFEKTLGIGVEEEVDINAIRIE
ncbi:hypothetical protein GGQ84_003113 [Desulfitispora alkaliphila]|uniref:ethylbenzene dehydrogenase-related protein n=1 Tax=Desulfitispora alkaliphila TaxID=622674 RepID=UPI003D1B574E